MIRLSDNSTSTPGKIYIGIFSTANIVSSALLGDFTLEPY